MREGDQARSLDFEERAFAYAGLSHTNEPTDDFISLKSKLRFFFSSLFPSFFFNENNHFFFCFSRYSIMVRFKEYKRWDKIYLSVVEREETKAELHSTFIVYPSLLCPEFEQIPIIPRSDFASLLTTRAAE